MGWREIVLDGRFDRPVLLGLDIEGLGDDLGRARRVAQRSELDNNHAIVELFDHPPRDAKRQTRFANAACTGDRHQRLEFEGRRQRRHIRVSANERRRALQPRQRRCGRSGDVLRAGRKEQVGVIGQDLRFEFADPGRHIEAHLPSENRAEFAGAPERLGLASGPV